MPIEIGLFEFLHGLAGKSALFDFLFVLLARWLPYVLVAMATFFLFTRKGSLAKVWGACVVGLTVVLSRGILVELISYSYARPRPNVLLGFDALIPIFTSAFPSGHASAFFALAAATYFLNREWGKWFWILAGVNAIARIIAGVHWPTDILGGLAVALISFFAVKKLLLPFVPKPKTEPRLHDSFSSVKDIKHPE